MTGLELWIVFTLGIVSSLHCVQMCGPIVLSYSVALGPAPTKSGISYSLLFGHIAYNAGRILTYAALGAIAGLAGQTVGLIGRLAGVGSALAIIGGVLMLIAGLAMFGLLPAANILGGRFFRITSGFLRPLAKLISSPSLARRFLLGLALGGTQKSEFRAGSLRSIASCRTRSACWLMGRNVSSASTPSSQARSSWLRLVNTLLPTELSSKVDRTRTSR